MENEQVLHFFQPLVPDIERALRRELKNSQLHMRLRVAEAREQVRVYSKREQFQQMLERSEGLRKLNAELGLTLS
ncbi:dNA polymerase III subunit gamma and tau [Prevotella sp. CAG:755]|nr:dNA polymerase III subunit gamma and tau [Prevotella sp. CAG:755]